MDIWRGSGATVTTKMKLFKRWGGFPSNLQCNFFELFTICIPFCALVPWVQEAQLVFPVSAQQIPRHHASLRSNAITLVHIIPSFFHSVLNICVPSVVFTCLCGHAKRDSLGSSSLSYLQASCIATYPSWYLSSIYECMNMYVQWWTKALSIMDAI